MTTDDDYDYWTEGPRTAPSEVSTLTIETIEDVEPLDTQFGVAEPLSVPAVLHDLVWQTNPTEAERAVHGGDPAKMPPLNIYAILDAAKVTNLPEMLETSGLLHRCLFKGAAYDELRDAAPWIVQLADSNSFTRNLFTRSDAPWHLWDKEPGIYIRSRGSLDDLWKHFRKFTRVQDETGKWYYWRFWEGAHIGTILQDADANDQKRFFMDGKIVAILIVTSGTESVATQISFKGPRFTSK